jgi:pilus assembly protein Flp/PilA
MMTLIKRFCKDEDGATMVEYALMVALVGLAAAAGVVILGNGLSTMFSNIGTEVSTATVPNIP